MEDQPKPKPAHFGFVNPEMPTLIAISGEAHEVGQQLFMRMVEPYVIQTVKHIIAGSAGDPSRALAQFFGGFLGAASIGLVGTCGRALAEAVLKAVIENLDGAEKIFEAMSQEERLQ